MTEPTPAPQLDEPQAADIRAVTIPAVENHSGYEAKIDELTTSLNMQRHANETLQYRLNAAEASRDHLRDLLDGVRRELALANSRLAQYENSPSGRADIVELSKRVEKLERDWNAPAAFELVEAAALAPAKVEVKTLISEHGIWDSDNTELAAALNDGWEIVPALSGVGRNDGEEWAVEWRIVTLTREVEDDPDAGGDPEAADAVTPDSAESTEPVAVTDWPLNAPVADDLVKTYLNAAEQARADGLVISAQPLVSIYT